MFEQDYIMRVIKEMVRVILRLVFNINTESPTAELLDEKEGKETLGGLLDLVDDGNINQAQSELFELLKQKDRISLEIALLFYSYLNDKKDEFLEENDFDREEIKKSLKMIISQYGLKNIVEIFLTEL